MSVILSIENISKQYRLGQIGTGTLSHDLNKWWAQIRGQENPYLKIGESNDRSTKSNSDYVWALRDINIQVNQGEVLGIIGNNGAGKSTLLKILSKVTGPTSGQIKRKGRIASLLEVGTGFHPELSGMENIFLNGAILGMSKSEIKSKLDEIIAFSGIERYIDTPVKRYSSGMFVRLAFAVAAHLEPEILIIDEVLAVGDVEFQKKCLAKMDDDANTGRTILFVSHNMNSISSLCGRCILLNNGLLEMEGSTDTIISQYMKNQYSNQLFSTNLLNSLSKTNPIYISGFSFLDKNEIEIESNHVSLNTNLYFKINYSCLISECKEEKLLFVCYLKDNFDNIQALVHNELENLKIISQRTNGEVIVSIENINLRPESYILGVEIKINDEKISDTILSEVEIIPRKVFSSEYIPFSFPSTLILRSKWKHSEYDN